MKHKKLTLSLVIPVYNEEGYLEACLGAVAAQTIMPNEVIIIDNGSTDRTASIARSYPFARLISEKRRGVLFARNKGFNLAKSDIIGRVDADTILPPRWTENVKKSFRQANIAAATGPVGYYDMPFPQINHYPDHLMRSSIYNWSPKSPFLFGSNMAIRRQFWLKMRSRLCQSQDIHEDLDLATHLYESGHKILYDKNLQAAASGRRYNDNPAQFYEYMSMYRQTYLRHGLHSLAIYSAIGVYWLGYALIHPFRNVWYSLYIQAQPPVPISRQTRKNPMHS